MRILIFSDVHLTDVFDEKKYLFLKKIISEADRVIINGDFWDGYLTTFDRFITAKQWYPLFDLLKKKKSVYIFGNHDKKEYSDKRIELFSEIQEKKYEIKIGNRIYEFEHGDRIAPAIDEKIPSRYINRILTHIANAVAVFQYQVIKENILSFISRRAETSILKKTIALFDDKNRILVCGHTHLAQQDVANNYLNSGFINYGLASYLIIDEKKAVLKEEKYV